MAAVYFGRQRGQPGVGIAFGRPPGGANPRRALTRKGGCGNLTPLANRMGRRAAGRVDGGLTRLLFVWPGAVARAARARSGGDQEKQSVGPLGLMAPPQGSGQGNLWLQTLGPLVFFFLVFYFLLIRPARARQKQTQEMLEALRPGDKVTTTGGLLGTVVAVDRDIVQLRIADKVKVDITRSAIIQRQEGSGASPEA